MTGSWLSPQTCTATHDGRRCCRYEGHLGDHEEWLDGEGHAITPLKGRMSASWPREHLPDRVVSSQGEHARCVVCGEVWPCAAAQGIDGSPES